MPAYITRTSYLTNISRTLKLEKFDQDDMDRIVRAYEEGMIPNIYEYLTDKGLSYDAVAFIVEGTTREERETHRV